MLRVRPLCRGRTGRTGTQDPAEAQRPVPSYGTIPHIQWHAYARLCSPLSNELFLDRLVPIVHALDPPVLDQALALHAHRGEATQRGEMREVQELEAASGTCARTGVSIRLKRSHLAACQVGKQGEQGAADAESRADDAASAANEKRAEGQTTASQEECARARKNAHVKKMTNHQPKAPCAQRADLQKFRQHMQTTTHKAARSRRVWAANERRPNRTMAGPGETRYAERFLQASARTRAAGWRQEACSALLPQPKKSECGGPV